MKNRPAARQLNPELQPHVVSAFREYFSMSVHTFSPNNSDSLEGVITRQAKQALTDVLDDIDEGNYDINYLMRVAGSIEADKAALVYMELVTRYCGATEQKNIRAALEETVKAAIAGRPFRDAPKLPRQDDLSKELQKAYIELRRSGQLKPTWLDVVKALAENDIIQEVVHDEEKILWKRANHAGTEETTKFENIPARMTQIKKKLKKGST